MVPHGISRRDMLRTAALGSLSLVNVKRVLAQAPILEGKDAEAASVFSPLTVLTEAKRQKHLPAMRVPAVCVLDPDGDIVRWLKRTDRGTPSATWACCGRTASAWSPCG